MIKFDFQTYTKEYLNDELHQVDSTQINKIKEYISKKQMTGWYYLDKLFDKSLIDDIKETASYIKNNCEVFLVIGIGGSYSESIGVIEALKPYFYNDKIKPAIYYLGTSLSSDYYHDLALLIKDKDIIINVISKSGNTLETEITYQLIKELMDKKYLKEELNKRIIMTTNNSSGYLYEESQKNGYKLFVVPDNIGGRYSGFTPVGLLPMAVADINLNRLYEGAVAANSNYTDAINYAVVRRAMYDKKKYVEAFVTYEPKLALFMEWLKQLFCESLGKEEKGLLAVSLINTRDLHSLGQFVQQGNKILFETVINIKKSKHDIKVDKYNLSLHQINNYVSEAVTEAHLKGHIPNNIITIDELDEYHLGYLMQFFMLACVINGYMDNVNPFDQNGVEDYKKIAEELINK